MRALTVLILSALPAWCGGRLLPLAFEERVPGVFVSGTVSFTREGAAIRVGESVVRMKWAAVPEGAGAAGGSNYILPGFRKSFPLFSRLRYRQVYPGVDLVFYGNQQELEFDFTLAPGASPERIQLAYEGVRRMRIDAAGDLILETGDGELRQKKPAITQERKTIPGHYVIQRDGRVGIRVGRYDPGRPLVIDPVLVYSKSLSGGGMDRTVAVALDGPGNAYVLGTTTSVDFPTTDSVQPRSAGPPLSVSSDSGQTFSFPGTGEATNVGAIGGTLDGRTLYAATSAGVIRSTDGGNTWARTNAQFAPTTIAADPGSPNIAWAGTRQTIFKTVDGGEIWTASSEGLGPLEPSFGMVSQIVVSPAQPATVFALTSSPNRVWRSTNGGANWVGLNIRDQTATVAVDPKNPDIVYVSGVYPPGSPTQKSVDRGETWTPLGSYGTLKPGGLAVDPSNPDTIYIASTSGSVAKSTDGGRTFSESRPPNGGTLGAIVIDPANPSRVYVSAQPGSIQWQVCGSADGGASWNPVSRAFLNLLTLYAAPNRLLAGTVSAVEAFLTKLDPSGNIVYSTYLGGSAWESPAGIAVDRDGNAYITGYTQSPDFPFTTGAFQEKFTAPLSGFVAKVSADGGRLIYSTALSRALPAAIAVDAGGNAYVTGATRPEYFTFTAGAYQTSAPGPCTRSAEGLGFFRPYRDDHAFAAKLKPDGSGLVYSTLLTGSCGDGGIGITVDSAGRASVAGTTLSLDFPITAKAAQAQFPGKGSSGFVATLYAAGASLLYSSFLGGGMYGSANAVAQDREGNLYVTGDASDFAIPATPGTYRNPYRAGCPLTIPTGPAPPSVPGDVFIVKLNPASATPLLVATLGGGCADSGRSIALDPAGNIWIAGESGSPDFPTAAPLSGMGAGVGFVSELSPDATRLLFSSLVGAAATLALDPRGPVIVAGSVDREKPPLNQVLATAQVLSIDSAVTNLPVIDTVLHSTSPPVLFGRYGAGIAPGELVRVVGRGIGPAVAAGARFNFAGLIDTEASDTQVTFDGLAAPLISVQAQEILCLAPFALDGKPTTLVQVKYAGQKSNAVNVGVVPVATALPLAIANQDATPNSAANPARPGSVITLYITGLGQTEPPSRDGSINRPPLARLKQALTEVYVGGNLATVDYAGPAPALAAGIYQINIRIPLGAYTSPSYVSVGGIPATVYIAP